MRTRLSGVLLAALLSSCVMTAVAGPPAHVPIEQRLTAEQMRATGLDQLSPTQLAALNDVLASETSASVQRAKAEVVRDSGREPVESRIIGPFKGWDTGTVFTLEDGSRWQVTQGSFNTRAIDAPRVTVKPGMLSGWYMHVEGQPVVASVKRVR